ncbi:MAG: sugar kinase [Anaerolineae bacterium]|nr:sugar kinase [Anaerolineae bacterium]
MSPRVIALGELLVEIMRPGVDQPLSQPGEFVGPFPSGAPAIFIDAVARLGVPAGFVGVVAPDAFGECVLERLRRDGVDVRHIRTAHGYTTGIAFVSYKQDGSRHFVFHLPQAAAALLCPDDVEESAIAKAEFVHVTGSALSISESARQACYKAVWLCKQHGGRVSFDPNIRPELSGVDQVREICQPVLDQCDLLLPSGEEATMLTGDADQESACRALVKGGIDIVALKRGAAGSTVFTPDREIEAPSMPVTEIDPTGAGDCYGGAFVVGLLEGWDLPRVARFANVVGALAVTKKGPMEGAPWRDDVEQVLGKGYSL